MVNGRLKGNRFENEVCRLLSELVLGRKVKKMSDCVFRRRTTSVQPVEGHWEGSGDLVVKPGINWGWTVECKCVEGWTMDSLFSSSRGPVFKWWEQAVRQGSESKPMLVFTRNRAPIYVMMSCADAVSKPSEHCIPALYLAAEKNTCVVLLSDLVKRGRGVVLTC